MNTEKMTVNEKMLGETTMNHKGETTMSKMKTAVCVDNRVNSVHVTAGTLVVVFKATHEMENCVQPSTRQLNAMKFMLAAELERRSEGCQWFVEVGDVLHCGNLRQEFSVSLKPAFNSKAEMLAVSALCNAVRNDVNTGAFSL